MKYSAPLQTNLFYLEIVWWSLDRRGLGPLVVPDSLWMLAGIGNAPRYDAETESAAHWKRGPSHVFALAV